MSYNKQTWTNGDVITAQKMNHIEDGIANSGGSFLIKPDHIEDEVLYYDKTWQELYDAMEIGQNCVIWSKNITNNATVINIDPIIECVGSETLGYLVYVMYSSSVITAESADAYLHSGGGDPK